jgi:hypothetical protein
MSRHTFFQFCRELLQTDFYIGRDKIDELESESLAYFSPGFSKEESVAAPNALRPWNRSPMCILMRNAAEALALTLRNLSADVPSPGGRRAAYANAGITSRANNSTVWGGAISANMIVNIVIPQVTRSRNCAITSSGVPFTAVNENGLRPFTISHF